MFYKTCCLRYNIFIRRNTALPPRNQSGINVDFIQRRNVFNFPTFHTDSTRNVHQKREACRQKFKFIICPPCDPCCIVYIMSTMGLMFWVLIMLAMWPYAVGIGYVLRVTHVALYISCPSWDLCSGYIICPPCDLCCGYRICPPCDPCWVVSIMSTMGLMFWVHIMFAMWPMLWV